MNHTSTTTWLYSVYGVTLSSEIPLPLPLNGEYTLATITLTTAGEDYFAAEVGTPRHDPEWTSWFQYAPLPDGRSYVRGWEMGEVLVSADGLEIVCRADVGSSPESFHVYLLGQALSFALLKLGFEPLHATAVVIDGMAVALLGESGSGKSTLAASFVTAGFPLLTDDVLMLHDSGNSVLAYPGPARLKLFPNVAARFISDLSGTAKMNNQTAKLLVALGDAQMHDQPTPLVAIYDVEPPPGAPGSIDVRIGMMSGRDAALALVRATFNQRFVNRDRLTRQFSLSITLAERGLVRRLTYPRLLSRLPDVVSAVLDDVAQTRVRRAVGA